MSSEAISESTLLREFTREIHNRNAAIFAGAGLSMASGYVDWKSLLKDLITDLGLDPNTDDDLVTLAQYHCNQAGGNKARLTQLIFDQFSRTRLPTRNHAILARLPIYTYWTTNYDKLIEQALVDAKKVPDVKYTLRQLAVTRLDRDVVVYKMHGDVDHAAVAVICKDDYEAYPLKMSAFVSALRGDLIEKTFLFLGFSFTDPNIDYILSRVRVQYEQHARHHYCVQKKVSKHPGESDAAFNHRGLKQHYFIRDLKRFGSREPIAENRETIGEGRNLKKQTQEEGDEMKTATKERNGTVKACKQAGAEMPKETNRHATADGAKGLAEAASTAGEKGKRRNGHVARLSKEVRDRINGMIEDGVTYGKILERLGEDAKGISASNLSRWKDGGYQDWLAEQAFVERIRARQETPKELVKDFDATEVNHAALQLGALHIFEAMRELRPGSLNEKLGGDCGAFARLLNALARASRETMQLQRYREACAKARAALRELDPKRKLDESETRAIVRKVDEILGLAPESGPPSDGIPESPSPEPPGNLPPPPASGVVPSPDASAARAIRPSEPAPTGPVNPALLF